MAFFNGILGRRRKTFRFNRRTIHLSAGLTMFAYVLCHLINHAFIVISVDAADAASAFLIEPWASTAGIAVLSTAALVHISLALWTTYNRRSLSMPVWQWMQLGLGLSIPYLLAEHALTTSGAAALSGMDPDYEYMLAIMWYFSPFTGWLQLLVLVVTWAHATVGIHHWLKVKPWYSKWYAHLYGLALVIPALALMGFVAGGFETLEKMRDPRWFEDVLKHIDYAGPGVDLQVALMRDYWFFGYTALLGFVFIFRQLRIFRAMHKDGVRATYPSGRRVLVPLGATLLETSRAGNIPHASVCGGRGRCSTCRVLILKSAPGSLEPPSSLEKRILDRLQLPPNVRLACQVRPSGDVTCEPLLPPDVTAHEALSPGQYMHGREMDITVMFADLRGFTELSESKLPFDVVFMLNQYFQSMGTAIEGAGGHIDKFIGDGIMALFGTEDIDRRNSRNANKPSPSDQALIAAHQMALRLQKMNERLKNELTEPLRLGISIHRGPAILGTMGHGAATQVTAIGDTVNTAARLESITKDLGVQLLVSSTIEARSKLDLSAFERTSVDLRGRTQSLKVRKIKWASELPIDVT